VFDREWRENMSLEEGIEVIKKCIHELRTRFLVSQPVFVVKVVDANGVRTVDIS
jgi:20S proteasome subunit beta 4